MEISGIIKDISLIIASFTAICGIWAWRREYIGKKKIELVEEVLALFYEAKDNISYMRNPFGLSGEDSVNLNSSQSSEMKWAIEQANILFKRYKQKEQSFNRLYSLKYRFIINFGKNSEEPFNELTKILNELSMAAMKLAHYWGNLHRFPEKDRERFIDLMEKNEKIFWERIDEYDEIKNSIDNIIIKIEDICKPIIKSLSK